MPSFSKTLEEAIHYALSLANERKHELATLEHLLLALIDEPDAARVMKACGVDLDSLRESLTRFVDNELEALVSDVDGSEAAPTTGFQRVIQRAIIHTQSSGREVASGANVLVAIFSERESHAVWFLKSMNMTRLDAVTFISHGAEGNVGRGTQEKQETESGEAEGQDPLSLYAVDLIAKAAAL